LALVRAALWAFSEKKDLSGDVSDQSFNVRILAALVRNGLYKQNADFSLCCGAKLLKYEGTVPGGADLVTCSRDAVLLSGLDSSDCNGPGCFFGGDRDQNTIDQLRNKATRMRYDAPTPEQALEACGALSYLRSDHELYVQNRYFSHKFGKWIAAVLDGPEDAGLTLYIQCPKT